MTIIPKKVAAFVARVRASVEPNTGIARLASKDVAALIRLMLAYRHPRTKFSVRSEYNSVRIGWNDGPFVCDYLKQYSFGGFDGMIDMAFSCRNWLLPDGTMTTAYTSGTAGSRGTVSAIATDCPMPGAILVDSPCQYVLTQRNVTDERYDLLALEYQSTYRVAIDFEIPFERQAVRGENLYSALHRFEHDIADGRIKTVNAIEF